MLSSIIIGGDPDLVRYLRQVCAEFSDICIYKILGASVRRYEIVAVLNTYVPDVVFLDVSDMESPDSPAAACMEELLAQQAQTAVVPFSNRRRVSAADDPGLAVGPMLTVPFNAEQLESAVREALRRGRPAASVSNVWAFLPAKPGAGATTVALHVAAAAAQGLRQRTLLIEADQQSGSIGYMLNLRPAAYVGDAIENRMLNEGQWAKVVSRSQGVDILPASAAPQAVHGSRWDFYRLLKFARERYAVVIVDMPAQIDDVAESIIAEADKVVLVSTPDAPSLSMVRRRLWELETRGVRHRHLRVLVNRHGPGDPDPQQMAATAQYEVNSLAPEDATALKNAGRSFALTDTNSRFGRRMASLSRELLGTPATEAAPFPFGLIKAVGRAWDSFSHGVFEPSGGKQ